VNHSWSELLELARGRRDSRLLLGVAARSLECLAEAPRPLRGEPYGRKLLHREPGGEVMLARWVSGGRSAPHDHGDSTGVVIVLAGRFTETHYRFDGCALLAARRLQLAAREIVAAERGGVHDMYAHTSGVTLHFYFPAIDAMCVYDAEARATLRVSEGAGAWIPDRPELIRERSSWRGQGNRGRC
jgi:hypothetical protein